MRTTIFLLISPLLFLLTGCSQNLSRVSVSTQAQQYGMERLAARIYVDPAMLQPQRQQLLHSVRRSRMTVSRFYGEMHASPMLYVCWSDACLKAFGGIPAVARSLDDHTVILSRQGINEVILTHELAHIELHKRLGRRQVWNKIPMWFDEGLAVLISDDPQYKADEKKVTIPLDKLVYHDQWVAAVQQKKAAYHRARQVVEAWYKQQGRAGLLVLLERLKQGGTFTLEQAEATTLDVGYL